MADVLVRPGRLQGQVSPPPAKSDAHRALIAAGLCVGRKDLTGLPDPLSEDLAATCRCLDALLGGKTHLDCGESGTTLRLLLPIAGALAANRRAAQITFSGRGRLSVRPLGEYLCILTAAGLCLQHPPDAFLPLHLTGHLQPGVFQVPGNISSQYISGLLFALPLLAKPSEIRLTTPLESAPYVEMTRQTLARFGISIQTVGDGFRVPAPQLYRPVSYDIEKDYSQAAFWLVAAYGGCRLTVSGLPQQTAQGDRIIAVLLDQLASRQRETVIDAAQIPDLVPALAVAAILTPTHTRIIRAGRLRFKESDRLQTTCHALYQIGADIETTSDGLLIHGAGLSRRPGGLDGGTIDAGGDHRIAMALAVAALFTRDGIIIQGAEAVRKSYPDFFHQFLRLGGDVSELNMGEEPEHQLVW